MVWAESWSGVSWASSCPLSFQRGSVPNVRIPRLPRGGGSPGRRCRPGDAHVTPSGGHSGIRARPPPSLGAGYAAREPFGCPRAFGTRPSGFPASPARARRPDAGPGTRARPVHVRADLPRGARALGVLGSGAWARGGHARGRLPRTVGACRVVAWAVRAVRLDAGTGRTRGATGRGRRVPRVAAKKKRASLGSTRTPHAGSGGPDPVLQALPGSANLSRLSTMGLLSPASRGSQPTGAAFTYEVGSASRRP
jgi:hypothetical protein